MNNKITGKQIFDQLKLLDKEVQELATACDSVADELGRDSIAYKLLDKAYKETKSEFLKLQAKEYIPYDNVF